MCPFGSCVRVAMIIVMVMGLPLLAETDGVRYGRYGVCQPSKSLEQFFPSLSWVRLDLPWDKCEPTRGAWSEDYLREWIERAVELQKQGYQVLPVLGYNTSWSWDRSERTFAFGSRIFRYKPLGNNQYQESQADRRNPSRLLSSRDVKGGKMFPLDPQYAEDWKAYVGRVVGALAASPLRTRYFEVWNEAYPTSGFWRGSMDDYFRLIHLPAAEVIHKQGAKVVYGGWPCVGPLHEFIDLMDQHKAWASVDVLSLHYFPLSAMEQLARVARQRTGREYPVWQTEFGFSPKAGTVGNFLPRFLHWDMRRAPKVGESSKVFYFAEWSPDSPDAYGYGRCLRSGDTLTIHGKSLSTFLDLLQHKGLRRINSLKSTPAFSFTPDGNRSGWECFETPQAYVIAVHLAVSNPTEVAYDEATGDTFQPMDGNTGLRIQFPPSLASKVGAATRVAVDGTVIDAVVTQLPDHSVEVEVPWVANKSPLDKQLVSEGMLTFYVRIEKKK